MFQLDQTTRVQETSLAQSGPDKLQAGYRDRPIVHRDWNRERRISSKIHRNGVLQVQHARFQKGYPPNERNCWRQRLKGWQSDEINFSEGLAQGALPLRSPVEGLPVLAGIQNLPQ